MIQLDFRNDSQKKDEIYVRYKVDDTCVCVWAYTAPRGYWTDELKAKATASILKAIENHAHT